MGFFSDLWNGLFNHSAKETISAPSQKEIVEAGACPNCWGKQEYDNKYIAFRKDKTKANISNAEQKAFVTQFVETHVSGIKLLTKDDRTYCPKCNNTVDA